jgi:hypothetical protein
MCPNFLHIDDHHIVASKKPDGARHPNLSSHIASSVQAQAAALGRFTFARYVLLRKDFDPYQPRFRLV